MQIVIDIPEEDYVYIAKKHCFPSCDDRTLRKKFYEMVANGTPLPKGHGRILVVSEDAIKKWQTSFSFSCQKWINEVGLSNATMAIIEADKAESEEV